MISADMPLISRMKLRGRITVTDAGIILSVRLGSRNVRKNVFSVLGKSYSAQIFHKKFIAETLKVRRI